ncbi:OprD family outer membrane porin, partial [Aegicerativicinus sediminis]
MFKHQITLVLLFINLSLWPQNAEKKESTGDLSGQWRTFYMNTINDGHLKDFNALATGGYVKYEYKFSKGFYLGGALYTSINTNIQDLTEPDLTTGKTSRYEEGLFDLENLEEDWIALIGELYAGYKFGRNDLKIGRMKLKTPFLNPEDGRMIPTLVQGIWYRHNSKKGAIFQLGYIDRIAPRSTSKFFNIGKSIGLYPVGRDLAGQPSLYREKVTSNFILVANGLIPINERFS